MSKPTHDPISGRFQNLCRSSLLQLPTAGYSRTPNYDPSITHHVVTWACTAATTCRVTQKSGNFMETWACSHILWVLDARAKQGRGEVKVCSPKLTLARPLITAALKGRNLLSWVSDILPVSWLQNQSHPLYAHEIWERGQGISLLMKSRGPAIHGRWMVSCAY